MPRAVAAAKIASYCFVLSLEMLTFDDQNCAKQIGGFCLIVDLFLFPERMRKSLNIGSCIRQMLVAFGTLLLA